jgi:hypothetical protein
MTSASVLQPRQPTRLSSLWHPAIVLGFIAILYLGRDIVSLVRNADGHVNFDLTFIDLMMMIIGAGLIVFELVMLVISLFQFAPMRVISHVLALALFGILPLFAHKIVIAVQHFNLIVFHSRYEACAQAANSYSNEGRFRLCSISGDGNAYTMIVFDSGDEISLPKRRERSEAFNEFLSAKVTSILSECRTSTGKRLDDHFYLVQSDCDSRPE